MAIELLDCEALTPASLEKQFLFCNYEGRIFHALNWHRSLAYQTAIAFGNDAIAEAEPLIRLRG